MNEKSRHDLHTRLETVLGEPEAATLMELVPPVGWGEVATKSDLNALEAATKQDFSGLRAEFSLLRSEFGELRADFRQMHAQLHSQFRTTLFAMFSMFLTLIGVIFAAVAFATRMA